MELVEDKVTTMGGPEGGMSSGGKTIVVWWNHRNCNSINTFKEKITNAKSTLEQFNQGQRSY
jgi:GTPase involved in cell partitioning and DNA repair